MKDIIKKVLKEQEEDFNPDDLKSPEISISPRTQLDYAQHKYEWESYIPEISRKIRFYVNPEEWNMMAHVDVQKVESKGEGSFGKDPHRDYMSSPLDKIYDTESWRVWYGGQGDYVDQTEETPKKRAINYVDVKDAIEDMKNYSEEAEKLVTSYKNSIQQLTRNLQKDLSGLRKKHNFESDTSVELVSVDSKGNYKTEREFEEEGKDSWSNKRDFETLYGKKTRQI